MEDEHCYENMYFNSSQDISNDSDLVKPLAGKSSNDVVVSVFFPTYQRSENSNNNRYQVPTDTYKKHALASDSSNWSSYSVLLSIFGISMCLVLAYSRTIACTRT